MDNQTSTLTLAAALKGAGIAAAAAVVANNIWFLIAGQNVQNSPVNSLSVTMASLVPMLLAGLVYFGLSKISPRYQLIFTVGAAVLTLASLAGPFQPNLPDGSPTPEGFATLTVPMHLIAGLCAVFLLPRFAK